MGGCLSSGSDSVSSSSSSSALVISSTGDLRPYSTPVLVSNVLQTEDSSSSSSSFFVCNSDNLSYDEHITPLDAQDELDAGQIYFVLPVSKLRNPLSASEMAALAVKASVALNGKSNSKASTRSKSKAKTKSKVSPFVVMESSKINVIVDQEAQNKCGPSTTVGVSRSGSIRKMQRYSSRKARLAVRSFKLRLSTIYEDQSHKYR
ncbi:hypothetical protein HanRHA438_Chr06g0287541 [Helianthus annuus]|uniref:DUF4228 domain protein n=1 Tax=Helianthus annuus TaxID=4232 RepID=A0A251TQF6_HELAN|nr:uncharacterized serine-rich protein C1E8.05 [Helianthus annuus]KAF5804034.1 hypothetical protein HanXRQr2_Chr06g0278371 [Helianthus annuus]KAJ0561915.1 hypothetical protein HanHA300_Chr06g0228401 [Helianthus annuus]KAJ0574980.1 hypothetical protein HanHA89_Chr06g0244351 [Helianthus annuus]KAJ0739310.1 hypothetical protein HanLR1_Chr06g0228401 [Helianthus annuus]KAJ0913613.1 hypothetical protein HanRHA438_Chr06g0287541 [Helianthus annuus]